MSIKLVDKIVRTKRRSVALVVTKQGIVVVRAPFKTPMAMIKSFVDKHQAWIERKKILQQEKLQCIKKLSEKKYAEGDKLLYEGKHYELKRGMQENICLADSLCIPSTMLEQAKEHLTEWYKIKALAKIIERVKHYAQQARLEYKEIKIINAKNCWGRCNEKKVLHFNWRLIMAPPDVLDYVVVHELAHLIELNHSQAFWQQVKIIYPNYEQPKKWLNDRGRTLVL